MNQLGLRTNIRASGESIDLPETDDDSYDYLFKVWYEHLILSLKKFVVFLP